MSPGALLPNFVALALAASLSMALYGLAALWAATPGRPWFWRWGPLVLLLAAPVPLGAYELVALFAAQAGTTLAGARLMRWLRQRRARKVAAAVADEYRDVAEEPQRSSGALAMRNAFNWPRFTLVDVLQGVLLVAAVAAILRLAAPSSAASIGGPIKWWPWLATGASFGMATVLALEIGCWRPWIGWLAIGILLTPIAWLINDALKPIGLRELNFFPSPLIPPWGRPVEALICGAMSTALMAWVLAAFDDPAGVRAAVGRRRSPSSDSAAKRHELDALAAMGGPGGLALLAAWVLGTWYVELVPPPTPVLEPLPIPNGYDELTRAADMLNWAAIPSKDLEKAAAADCQAFVAANVPLLAAARKAMAKPCRFPLEFAYENSHEFDHAKFADLAGAFEAQAKAARDAGRRREGVTCELDIVALANAMSQGAAFFPLESICLHYQTWAAARLAKDLPTLDAMELECLASELERPMADREPAAVVIERHRLLNALALGWYGRSLNWSSPMPAVNEQRIADVRNTPNAYLRLIAADVAVRRYRLAKGEPPESLQSLVPEYLKALPIDPYSGKPLVYRRAENAGGGYLLYSVGSNGVDDGGQRVSVDAATKRGTADFFVDAPLDDEARD